MDGPDGKRDPLAGDPDPKHEVDEELDFHLEQRIRDYEARGMSPEEARAAAMERLGELNDVRAECTEILAAERKRQRRRERLRFSWLDFKLGLRMLARYPGLTLVGGLAMAFGVWIGAITFELSKQWIRPSLSIDEADRIVGIQFTNTRDRSVRSPTMRAFLAWRESVESVDELSAFRTTRANLITPESSGEPVEVAEISASAFEVARVPPHLGRFLVPSDQGAGAPPVLVLGYDVWQERFAGDPAVIGRTVRLGGGTATAVGVMPEGFAFPIYHEAWIPLPAAPSAGGRAGSARSIEWGSAVRVFGRLAEGVSLGEARTELSELGRRNALDFPETYRHLRPRVVSYVRSILPLDAGETLMLRSINVLVVMLVVLVFGNVALLTFARAATRESEIVVRNALGASRGRIAWQLFAEALVLGAAGTVVGLAAARYGMRFAVLFLGENLGDLPYWVSADLSPATFVYAAALTVIGAAIAGVLPALRVTRSLGTRLRQAGTGGGGLEFSGLLTAVIVAQVAVTVTFPVVALFMWRVGAPIQSFDVGFDEGEYLSAELALEEESRRDPVDRSVTGRRGGFRGTLEELERRLSAESAVVGVTFANRLPRTFHPEYPIDVVEDGPTPRDSILGRSVKGAAVDVDYLELLGAPILAGRGFHAGDLEPGERVVIVNRSFVDEVLRGRNAVGRRIRFIDVQYQGALAPPEPGPWYEIVGVVGDLGMYHEGGRAGLYQPLSGTSDGVFMLVKVRGDPAAFAPRLRTVANAVDPTLQVHDLRPLSELGAGLLRAVAIWIRSALLVCAVALLLSLAAIYSVMSFTVSRRTREIGIRVALGADARRLLLAVFRRPLAQVATGIVAGGILVALLVRSVVGYLSARELGLVIAYAAVMMAVCTLSCIVPTRRALRVEPTEALGDET